MRFRLQTPALASSLPVGYSDIMYQIKYLYKISKLAYSYVLKETFEITPKLPECDFYSYLLIILNSIKIKTNNILISLGTTLYHSSLL